MNLYDIKVISTWRSKLLYVNKIKYLNELGIGIYQTQAYKIISSYCMLFYIKIFKSNGE